MARTSHLPSNDGGAVASNIGSCEFSSSDKIVKINTFFYSGQSPRDFKDFGEFSGLGRYVAIVKYFGEGQVGSSYVLYYGVGRQNNDDIFFPVLLNDKKEWWWTDCKTNKIGRLNSDGIREIPPISPNSLTTAISNFVCHQ